MYRSLKALAAVAALSCAPFAHAAINWSWSFEEAAAPYAPDEQVYVRAVLRNDASSTDTLDLSTMWFGASAGDALRDGIYLGDYGMPEMGRGGDFQSSSFVQFVTTGSVAPGTSASFDFFTFAPAAGGATAGNYVTNGWFGVCFKNPAWSCGFEDIQGSNQQFSWSVTPVPEPETWAMLMLGLGAMGAAARRKSRA